MFSTVLGHHVALRSIGFGMLVLLYRIRSLKYHASDIGDWAICGPEGLAAKIDCFVCDAVAYRVMVGLRTLGQQLES